MGSACSSGADRHVVVVGQKPASFAHKKDPYVVDEAKNGSGSDEKIGEHKNDGAGLGSESGQATNHQDSGAPSSPQHLNNKRVALNDLRVESVNDFAGNTVVVPDDLSPTSPTSTLRASGKNEDQLVSWVSNKLKNKLKLNRIAKAYERFIPSTFYAELGKQDIKEVDIGECVLVRKSVIFADIRNFTSFSSRLGPQDTFKFLNALSRRLLPVVRKYGGYIDKFIGDALVALFPSSGDGIAAGLEIMNTMDEYNMHRVSKNYEVIRVGIGCHTGALMLGTVGDNERMDGVALGSTMALSSQVEAATKIFGADFVITHATVRGIPEENKHLYKWRKIGMIKEGTEEQVIYQVFRPGTELPQEDLTKFDEGVTAFYSQQFSQAGEIFREVLAKHPKDRPSLVLEDRATYFAAKQPLPSDWVNGLTYHTVHMTKAGSSVLASGLKDSAPPGIVSHNFGLMRLVFSAIFHMQTMVSPKSDDESSESEMEDEYDDEEAHNPLMETIASVKQQNMLRTAAGFTLQVDGQAGDNAEPVVDKEK